MKTKLLKSFNKANLLLKTNGRLFSQIINMDYKYLVIQNTPGYWNENFLKEELINIGDIDYIKLFQNELPSSLENNITNNYIVKFNRINSNANLKKVEELSKVSDNITLKFAKNLKVNSISSISNKSNNKESLGSLILVHTKKEDTKLSDYDIIKELYLKSSAASTTTNANTSQNIKIKMNSEKIFAYIWFSNTKDKVEFENKAKEINDLYICQANSKSYSKPNDKASIISSSEENDLIVLKQINSKLEVLQLDSPLSKRQEAVISVLKEKYNAYKYILKKKENYKDNKKYDVIGNSGAIYYNF